MPALPPKLREFLPIFEPGNGYLGFSRMSVVKRLYRLADVGGFTLPRLAEAHVWWGDGQLYMKWHKHGLMLTGCSYAGWIVEDAYAVGWLASFPKRKARFAAWTAIPTSAPPVFPPSAYPRPSRPNLDGLAALLHVDPAPV